MHCLGISSYSPDDIILFLQKKNLISSTKDIQVVPIGTTLKVKKQVVFVLSINDLLRNIEVLNDSKAVVCVFSSPIRLSELKGIYNLDFISLKDKPGFQYTKLDSRLYTKCLRHPLKVYRDETVFLVKLTDSIKAGSLLTPLMTFIYTLSSSTYQTPVKKAVANYLYKNQSYKALEKVLDSVSSGKLNLRIKTELANILKSEVGLKYKEAFKTYRELKKQDKTISLKNFCKKFDVSDYEMSYILSVVKDS